MRTQQDHVVRVLALDNLRAMCKHASGMSHTFWIDKVSRSRIHVGYSNPSEYGTPSPVYAVLPCYPSPWPGDSDRSNPNPRVILDIARILHAGNDSEAWQLFEPLWTLYASHDGTRQWKIVECETDAASTAHLRAQHRAYHAKYDNGATCEVCRDTDTAPAYLCSDCGAALQYGETHADDCVNR